MLLKMQLNEYGFKIQTVKLDWFSSPLTASRSAETKWDEGEDLFEHRDKPRFVWLVRASSAAAHFVEQLRAAVGLDVGCLFVWLLYFGQAK
jgi:hypothetical protein